MRAWRGAAVLGALGLLALSGPALADHGKVGLWESSVSVTAPGADRPQVVTNRHCMTVAEVAGPALKAPPESGCTMQNTRTEGGTFSGDLVCTGQQKSSGHMTITYDGPEHYTGRMTLNTTAQDGSPVVIDQTMEGRWIAASCGNVTQ